MLVHCDRTTLRRLQLGMETEAAGAYSLDRQQLVPGGTAPWFKGGMLRVRHQPLDWVEIPCPTLSLDALIVRALDFEDLAQGEMGFFVKPNMLRSLSK